MSKPATPIAMNLHVDGAPVHLYTALPAGPSRTLVLVHGAGHDHSVWNFQARHLAARGVAVVVPDLPGHGRSGGAPLASIEALAGWLVALLDTLGVQDTWLAGHSMGSLIALEAAARLGPRARGLALIGSVLPMPVAPVLLDAARDDRARAHAMINQWSFSPAAQLGRSATPGTRLSNLNQRLMERQAPGVLHTDLAACNAYVNGVAAANAVCCPTLLVCGERDQMTPPRATQGLREALIQVPGGARMITVSGAGHALMAEAPDPVTDALRGMLG